MAALIADQKKRKSIEGSPKPLEQGPKNYPSTIALVSKQEHSLPRAAIQTSIPASFYTIHKKRTRGARAMIPATRFNRHCYCSSSFYPWPPEPTAEQDKEEGVEVH